MIEHQARRGSDALVLVGDVGGTKTDLAIVSAREGPRRPLAQKRYASQDYDGLEEVVRAFLAGVGLQVGAACFDVAGPVAGGRSELTNLPWRLREPRPAPALGLTRGLLVHHPVAAAAAGSPPSPSPPLS